MKSPNINFKSWAIETVIWESCLIALSMEWWEHKQGKRTVCDAVSVAM